MKTKRRRLFLSGIGVVVILLIAIVSFGYISASTSKAGREIVSISAESRAVWDLQRKITKMADAVRNFAITRDKVYQQTYREAAADAARALNAFNGSNDLSARLIREKLSADMDSLAKKGQAVFVLLSGTRDQRAAAGQMLGDLNGLQLWMERDLERYRDANVERIGTLAAQIKRNDLAIDFVFLLVLVTSLASIVGVVRYFNRNVSAPLKELWRGTEEIRRGNLDYRIELHGEGSISQLSERFNEMAHQLRTSYGELEQKLYERTHELASLDAVALTLSQAGSLTDMLDKSLLKILDSLSGIKPKGGVFLCDPGGETLRLTASSGLPHEFVQRESVIRMGECLCGTAAQTGELIFTEQGCEDLRHTRCAGAESHSHIIIPIKSRGIVLGVIFLYPQKDFTLKPSDIQMLDAIGAQLGMAVENFRFYAEVKESSEKFWDLFENATDILFTMDSEGRLTAVNKAAEAFTGHSKVELFGKSVFDFLTEEGAAAARRMLAEGGGRQWREFEVRKQDGGTAFIEVSGRKLYRNRQPAGYQISARDVTEQKRLREMVVEAERLGAIGQIVVTVRHEINNPLTTVIGNVELLQERYGDKDPALADRLETILNNSLRIAEIVKQLQAIKKDRVVEYVKGVKMTDLKQR